MPRKIQSSGEGTQQRRTSERRALGAATGPRGSRRRSATDIQDGGKWEGSGRKTIQHGDGEKIVRQAQTGRGPKTRTVVRKNKVNHPNKG